MLCKLEQLRSGSAFSACLKLLDFVLRYFQKTAYLIEILIGP